MDEPFIHLAASSLTRVARLEPMLSKDSELARVIERLESCAEQIKSDFR